MICYKKSTFREAIYNAAGFSFFTLKYLKNLPLLPRLFK